MLLLISPAKKLDFKPIPLSIHTDIRFQSETAELVTLMRKKSSLDLIKLMDISKALADLNVKRFKSFDLTMPESLSKQAVFAFNGDVYVGLKAEDFNKGDLDFSQKHLRILSGLYGLLRPLDLIQEYRLEMGCGLKVGKSKNLYEYWGEKLTDKINQDMKETKDKILVNLASEEYYLAVKEKMLNHPVLHIRFEEKRAGKYQVISFSAKKARGYMARYIIKNRIKKSEDLKSFDLEKYSFEPLRSEKNLLTFVR
ncbi:MAG: peroxide stress protein YaaA [Saprospiraceae bacterium]|nr:peroxide stress protein YaaA [Saprospiraceae bacterium]MBK6477061.1 peroxide stress protein YaaA [Saprospiraceae bacterium]MBP7801159.1 peroxide stress protein YaaA [Saprospiraceae bacterium]MBP8096280.1 peroxide stress protein YaaA [Saprospiraceae bacterium]